MRKKLNLRKTGGFFVVIGCFIDYNGCTIQGKDVVELKIVQCKQCGANVLRDEGNYYICEYCGTKFIKKTEGEGISLNSDIERLLVKCKNDPKNAKKYANLILDIDPSNRDALKYL